VKEKNSANRKEDERKVENAGGIGGRSLEVGKQRGKFQLKV